MRSAARRRVLAAVLAASLLGGAGCATAPATAWVGERPILLLGEVHDHVALHAERLAAFDALLATGARPAIVMEPFDRARQPLIDRLRAEGADAARLVAEAGGAGWDWAFYRPYVERALAHGLPLIAANVGRDEARAVMRDGLAAHGFDAAVPADVEAALAAQIEASHCGMVDAAMARRMALAQVARDQAMARAVAAAQASRGSVVLLAGNGHVRADVGVPRWLGPALRERAWVVGYVERTPADAAAPAAAFDRRVEAAPQPRPDPCATMRRPATPERRTAP